ncbi:TlpA family protein disulfide reductase, partial [Fulvivirga lutimaris]|uniref:TlpA family protein disulfide reductase n=1 Tax=Fulvivirga lutimaris TaxID=1819566 RepID=UPI001FE6042D
VKIVTSIILLILASFYTHAQSVEVIKYAGLDNLIKAESEKIEVINFWATWCGPCVKELPYFEQTAKELKDKINVNLISIDYVQEIEKVKKFVARKEIKSKVYLLDEIDGNTWIDKVEPSWSGAIPATLIINHATGEKAFVEHELKEGELEKLIEGLSK